MCVNEQEVAHIEIVAIKNNFTITMQLINCLINTIK